MSQPLTQMSVRTVFAPEAQSDTSDTLPTRLVFKRDDDNSDCEVDCFVVHSLQSYQSA